jgi:DNA-binding MarR family transcriptional regulator
METIPNLQHETTKLLTYSKIKSLLLLSIYGEDGYPYKYIIEDLDVQEGVAKPNIKYLEREGFIAKIPDDSQIVYIITEKGREALQQIFTWIADIQKYKDIGLIWRDFGKIIEYGGKKWNR